ncbi:MAG: hypothetical protein J6K66_03590 [Clostridia bacterium]|nr:hypothetical protein [Clostridia bacterium]
MKRIAKRLTLLLVTVLVVFALYSCKRGATADIGSGKDLPAAAKSAADTHEHTPFEENNIVEHEAQGYCGNTYTTVEYSPDGKTLWRRSFMASNSIAVVDMLSYLNYNDKICECKPEYNVYTEGGRIYGVSLEHGFVRADTAQVDLTAEQLERLREIFDAVENMTDATAFDVD